MKQTDPIRKTDVTKLLERIDRIVALGGRYEVATDRETGNLILRHDIKGPLA